MKHLTIALLVGFLALPVFGQQGPGGGGGPGAGGPGGGGPGGGGGFGGPNGQQITPAMIQQFIAQAQQRQLDNIKDQLQSTDDEFAAIQPYIQKVLQLQQSLLISRMSGLRFGGRGPNIGAMVNGALPPSELMTATTELQTAVDDQNSTAQIITIKLQALRDAKEKAAADLKAAQSTLRDLLTQRQEGILVWMGILE